MPLHGASLTCLKGSQALLYSSNRSLHRVAQLRALARNLWILAQELEDDGVIATGSVDSHPDESGGRDDLPSRTVLLQAARSVYAGRRLRDKLLGKTLFGEPAWDMLLALYANTLQQKRITTTSLCHASAVPTTTALRWVGQLDAAGLIRREPSQADGRVHHQVLTARGIRVMTAYFTRMACADGAQHDVNAMPTLVASEE